MSEHGHQRKVQGSICYAGIGRKDGKNTSQCASNEQGLFVKTNGETWHVRGSV